MLKILRDNLKKLKWVLLLVVASFLITIFAVWGGGGFRQGGKKIPSWAALVDGEQISIPEYVSALRKYDEFYSRLYGEKYDDMRKNLNLSMQVINELIEEKIVLQEALKLGITATPEDVSKKIMNHPAFMENGFFVGKERYERLLKATNRSVADFERGVKELIIMEKWRNLIGDSIFISNQELGKKYQEYKEKVSFDYIFLNAKDYEKDIQISDEEAQRYFAQNSSKYKKGESRRAKFISLSREEVKKEVQITENDVKNYYQTQINDFKEPEQVRASHILIKVQPEATQEQEEKAQTKVEEIINRLKTGESFEDLAKKFSEDETSAKNGGDLGIFARGVMVPEFEDMAFSTPVGEISPAFKTTYGFHVLKVMEKIPAKLLHLEEVSERIVRQLEAQKTQELLQQKMNLIRGEIENPEDFEKIAEKYKLDVKDTGFISQDQRIPEIGTSLEFQKALFTLKPFEVGGPVLTPHGEAILKYIEKVDERIPFFEEVKEKVKQDQKNEKAIELAYRILEKSVSETGGNLEAIAKKVKSDIRNAKDISRMMPLPNIGKAPTFMEDLFRASPKNFVGPAKTDLGAIFARVEAVNPFDPEEFKKEKEKFRENLIASQKEILIQGILENIRLRKSIEINSELIRQFGV